LPQANPHYYDEHNGGQNHEVTETVKHWK